MDVMQSCISHVRLIDATRVSLNSRLKGLPGPVSRVIRKKKRDRVRDVIGIENKLRQIGVHCTGVAVST